MHTLPLTPKYVPHIATLGTVAFKDAAFLMYLRPYHEAYPQYYQAFFARRLRKRLITPGCIIRICVSDDSDEWWDESIGEELLGFAAFERHGKISKQQQAIWGEDSWIKRLERLAFGLEEDYISYFNLDKSLSKPRYDAYGVALKADQTFEGLLEKDKGFVWLADLATVPRFQRRGVGKRLLQWGFDRSEKEGIPIGQVATVIGDPMYRRMGFEQVGTIENVGFDVGTPMVRWPKGHRRVKVEVVDG